MSSDNAKARATAPPLLDWQGELDSALAELDHRLTNPRRRVTDGDRPTAAPPAAPVEMTPELLDEIASRVAAKIRRTYVDMPLPPPRPVPPAPPADEHDAPRLKPGKMVMIRYKMPRLPWPLRLLQRRRKKEHPLTTARLRP